MYPVFWSIFMLRKFWYHRFFSHSFCVVVMCACVCVCVCVCCQNELRTEIRNMDGILFSLHFSFFCFSTFFPFSFFFLLFSCLVAGKYTTYNNVQDVAPLIRWRWRWKRKLACTVVHTHTYIHALKTNSLWIILNNINMHCIRNGCCRRHRKSISTAAASFVNWEKISPNSFQQKQSKAKRSEKKT